MLGFSVVAVALYHAASAGFTYDPGEQLQERIPFLQLADWLLDHPEAVLGEGVYSEAGMEPARSPARERAGHVHQAC